MRFAAAASLAIILCASSVRAQDPVFDEALRALPRHLRTLPDYIGMHRYAVAGTTVTGEDESFGNAAARFHDDAVAVELIAAYRKLSSIRIEATDVGGAPVLALDEFATGPMTYDWKRLREKHPDVKTIVRLSAPAIAGEYALIRVDVIGPKGPVWANFIELQRQADGSWQYQRAMTRAPG